jgi:hypothetical protein
MSAETRSHALKPIILVVLQEWLCDHVLDAMVAEGRLDDR